MKSPISWDIARNFFNGYFGEIMKYLQLYQTYIIFFQSTKIRFDGSNDTSRH